MPFVNSDILYYRISCFFVKCLVIAIFLWVLWSHWPRVWCLQLCVTQEVVVSTCPVPTFLFVTPPSWPGRNQYCTRALPFYLHPQVIKSRPVYNKNKHLFWSPHTLFKNSASHASWRSCDKRTYIIEDFCVRESDSQRAKEPAHARVALIKETRGNTLLYISV